MAASRESHCDQDNGAPSGCRVLVVEDMFLVAEDIADQLRAMGCDVVGPAGTLKWALAIGQDQALDGALLDINLGDETSFPLAAILRERGVPFAFVTAKMRSAIPSLFADAPVLSKPVDRRTLSDVIATRFVHH